MCGEIAVVRAFGDRLHIRRIWIVGLKVIYVCSEENFRRLAAGQEAYQPIAFPAEDVFRYDPAIIVGLMDNDVPNQSIWGRLAPWIADRD